MAAYMEMTQGTPTSTRKFTYSGWIKLMSPNSSADEETIFSIGASGDSYYNGFRFKTTAKLHINFDSTGAGGGSTCELITTAVYKDPAAWYHIVLACDTTQVASGDRLRLYVNGEEVTAFDTEVQPALNHDLGFLVSGDKIVLGRQVSGSSQYFNGNMSHVQFVDGLQLGPTEFGLEDSATGIWKIKTGCYATPGTNGFCLKMEDRTNLDLDSSSNAHTFTTGGTATPTKDNPSNNYATMNSVQPAHATITSTFACGNTKISGNNAAWQRTWSTMGITKGKWWHEVYIDTAGNSRMGWDSIDFINTGTDTSYYSGITIQPTGSIAGGISGTAAYSPNNVASSGTFVTGDYLGFGINMDDETFTMYKNGSAVSGLNPYDWSGISNNSCLIANGYFVGPTMNFESASGDGSICSFNFGNGVFGTTLLTGTTYTDSAGEGIFKYAPPTDYLAYCSNNLATYG